MARQFEGKVALITGASSGIGRATALAFSAEGARVALGARRSAECEELVREIQKSGGDAIFVQTDVSKAADCERLVNATVDKWGKLDIAFNNAGIEGPNMISTPDYPEEAWDAVIDINLKGVYLSMKYEIPHMAKHGKGAIVNMSSVAGLIGGPIGIAYYASKHGVIGATKAAAIEWAKSGVRVNAVCPAVIETPMAERIFGGMDPAPLVALHPIGRFGVPEEVARTVLFLCSDQASFITGVALPIDGGLVAR